MGNGRQRVTTDDIKAWANIGLQKLHRPDETIEYTVELEPYDLDHAIATERVRTSTWSALCLRRQTYTERYPKEAMNNPDTGMYDSLGTFRMLQGTAWHGLPVFKFMGGVQEIYMDHEGITGHIDWWLPEQRIIIDTKFTGWIPKDPHENHVLQGAGYYAEHNLLGSPTEQVFIWYVDKCLKRGTPIHEVFEIVLDHKDHKGLPAIDPDSATRFHLLLPEWDIDYIWKEVVQSRRKTILEGRKGVLPPRTELCDGFKYFLCGGCAYRSRCKLNAL